MFSDPVQPFQVPRIAHVEHFFRLNKNGSSHKHVSSLFKRLFLSINSSENERVPIIYKSLLNPSMGICRTFEHGGGLVTFDRDLPEGVSVSRFSRIQRVSQCRTKAFGHKSNTKGKYEHTWSSIFKLLPTVFYSPSKTTAPRGSQAISVTANPVSFCSRRETAVVLPQRRSDEDGWSEPGVGGAVRGCSAVISPGRSGN